MQVLGIVLSLILLMYVAYRSAYYVEEESPSCHVFA
jgi:hypothetical protein